MEARRRSATGVVVIVAIAAGAFGGVYLWKEIAATDTDVGHRDGGLIGDASTDARAGRGKPKVAKRGGRPRKPGTGPHPSSGGPHSASGSSGSGSGGGEEGQDVEDDGVEGTEPFNPPFRGRGPAGPTYEAMIASNKQEIVVGGKAEPDLTDAQLKGPMHDGAFVGECGAPDSMKVTVKVAIKMGRAAGVSVSTLPPDADIAGCIDRYVRTFSWPSSSKMDSFITTY